MSAGAETAAGLDVWRIREDFPALRQTVHGHPLVYLDNAATSQKPRAVLDAIMRFYERDCANVHRGVHQLSERSTAAYEGARETARQFLNAAAPAEIVFTRGATESINLVAQTYGRANLRAGDEILISGLEHHSNIVPWQLLAAEKGAILRVAPIDDRGEIVLEEYRKLLGPRTRIVALAQVSNALGTINPVKEMIAQAHAAGAVALIDGAQAAPHMPVDVRDLDCDFYAFSGHKVFGPTGIGVLYGKASLLDAMPPWQGGGDMISSVDFFQSTWNSVPHKFEAGTPDFAGAVGLHAAMDYLDAIGRDVIFRHDRQLAAHAVERLRRVKGLRLFGPATDRAGVVSFLLDNIHAHDVVTVADQYGVALRGGHHCNQPLMKSLGIESTARASFYFYNTEEEVDRLVEVLEKIQKFFGS